MNTTMSSGQMRSILELAEQKGLTPERMTEVLSSGVLADVLDGSADLSNRDGIRQILKLGPLLPASIIFIVDYGTAEKPTILDEMVAAGRYDWKNDDITAKRFPIVGVGQAPLECKLFHFNREISSDEAEKLIKDLDASNPWAPAKIEHLLTFGEKFPDEQRKYPIVALGSVAEVGGNRRVPYLGRSVSERNLDLGWHVDDWDAYYRFLAVRKVSVPSAA